MHDFHDFVGPKSRPQTSEILAGLGDLGLMDLNVTWEIQLPETTSEFAPENRPRLAPKRKFIDSKHPFCRCYLLLVSGEGKYEDVVALGRV